MALFGQYGAVLAVRFDTDQRSQERYALVTMDSEKNASRAAHALNGHRLEGRRLAVSYPQADLSRELTSKQRRAAEAVAAELGETEKVPVRQIMAMVQLCGSSFVQAILEEAKTVHASAGILTADGSRPRTLGGVFFYLARNRMAADVHQIVYNRKGKLPQPPPAGGPDA